MRSGLYSGSRELTENNDAYFLDLISKVRKREEAEVGMKRKRGGSKRRTSARSKKGEA